MVSGLLAGITGGAAVTIVIQAVDKYSKVFAGVNKTMIATGGFITGMGVAGLVAGKKLIDTAASFETAFVGVRKTVELTEAQFADLRQRFVDLSKEIPVSFQELSSIGEIAGQLGVEGVDNIEKFTKTIAGISVTTNMSSEEAATAFARIANVMGEPISNIDRMGSAIVDLGNNFATSEQEIVDMSMRIMGAGKTVGLSTEEVFGMSAALSSLGIRSEMGGSAMSRAMISIAQAVSEGGEELEHYAEVSGMTVEEFSNAWNTKPVEAMSNVIIGLKGISDSGGNTFGVLEDLDLKSIRITDTMLRLSGSEDGITEAVDRSKKAWEENTALVEEAGKKYGTTESQVTILKNKFDALKDQMGQTLIPVFIKVIGYLGEMIDWIGEHPKLTKFAVATGAIATALALFIGPLLIMSAIWPILIAGFALLATGMAPVLITILAIAAAIGAVILAVKIFNELTKKKKSKSEKQEEFRDLNPDIKSIEEGMGAQYLNNDPNAKSLNDFILTSSGKIIKPSPQDTIIGTKHPEDLGSGQSINIQIENVNGVDSEEISEALGREIKRVIRL